MDRALDPSLSNWRAEPSRTFQRAFPAPAAIFLSGRQGFVDAASLMRRGRDFSRKFPISIGNGTVVYLKTKMRIQRLFVCIALACAGCSIVGGAPDLERASGYRVEPPESWSRKGRAESDRAYSLPSGNVVTLVSSCHRSPDAPLDVLTRHLLMGTRGTTVKKREKATFGKNAGLHSTIVTKLEGKPFHLELFVLAKNECVFDFTLMSPREIPESDSQAFQQFVGSFQYGKD